MYKRNRLIIDRNEKIRARYAEIIKGRARMEVYMQLGYEFDLSDDRVRDIIAGRR